MKKFTIISLMLFVIVCILIAIEQYNSLILGTSDAHIVEAKALYKDQLQIIGACIVACLVLIYVQATEETKIN